MKLLYEITPTSCSFLAIDEISPIRLICIGCYHQLLVSYLYLGLSFSYVFPGQTTSKRWLHNIIICIGIDIWGVYFTKYTPSHSISAVKIKGHIKVHIPRVVARHIVTSTTTPNDYGFGDKHNLTA
jgi:hypothetical protein